MNREGGDNSVTPTLIISDDDNPNLEDNKSNMEIEYNQDHHTKSHLYFKLIGDENQIKVYMIYKIGTPQEKSQDVTQKIKDLSKFNKKISGARFHDDFIKGPQKFSNKSNKIRFHVVVDGKIQKIYTFIRSNTKRKNVTEIPNESKKLKTEDSKPQMVSILPRIQSQNHSMYTNQLQNLSPQNSFGKIFEQYNQTEPIECDGFQESKISLDFPIIPSPSSNISFEEYLDFENSPEISFSFQNDSQKFFFEPRYVFEENPPNGCYFRVPVGSNPTVKILNKKIKATRSRILHNELEEFTISLDFASILFQGNFQEFQINISYYQDSNLKTVEVTFMVVSNYSILTPDQLEKIESVQTKDFESFLSENQLKKTLNLINEKNSEELILFDYLKSLKDFNLKKSISDQIFASNQLSPYSEL
jgi:hypothetical protein